MCTITLPLSKTYPSLKFLQGGHQLGIKILFFGDRVGELVSNLKCKVEGTGGPTPSRHFFGQKAIEIFGTLFTNF